MNITITSKRKTFEDQDLSTRMGNVGQNINLTPVAYNATALSSKQTAPVSSQIICEREVE